ncbi:unnamed protein product [Cuscuta epithymum]|uniref:RING-type domain-containing protein n=1 Tax=Cuscuta epithymum TaxID=186058 RepID=A0AAV0EDN2_9ASTE|nr:unnamed protein product [Cuscuta epithymum]
MGNNHFHYYLCYQCFEGFRSTNEVTSCRLCLSELYLYEIQSNMFYIGDINNHRAPPLLVHQWQSRYHEKSNPSLTLERPGIVTRLIWRGRGEKPQPQPTGWKGELDRLQTTIEPLIQCSQWYWCYHCRRLGHIRETGGAVLTTPPLSLIFPEIMRCQECSLERAVGSTVATVDNHDPICWCYRCHTPYRVGVIVQSSSSSSSSGPICPRCEDSRFMSPVRIWRNVIIYGDSERDSPMDHRGTEISWSVDPLSHARWTHDRKEYFGGAYAVLGVLQLNHFLATIYDNEPYPPRSGSLSTPELMSVRTAGAVRDSELPRPATGQECRTGLEDLGVKKMNESSNLNLNLRGEGLFKLWLLVAAFIGGLLLGSLKLIW